ncbi:hypothetical protein FDECE_15208 [Fusarium decemcellulare]|nr:hypothetical protein FDECE_15208 [Fusarium decemcellulare]
MSGDARNQAPAVPSNNQPLDQDLHTFENFLTRSIVQDRQAQDVGQWVESGVAVEVEPWDATRQRQQSTWMLTEEEQRWFNIAREAFGRYRDHQRGLQTSPRRAAAAPASAPDRTLASIPQATAPTVSSAPSPTAATVTPNPPTRTLERVAAVPTPAAPTPAAPAQLNAPDGPPVTTAPAPESAQIRLRLSSDDIDEIKRMRATLKKWKEEDAIELKRIQEKYVYDGNGDMSVDGTMIGLFGTDGFELYFRARGNQKNMRIQGDNTELQIYMTDEHRYSRDQARRLDEAKSNLFNRPSSGDVMPSHGYFESGGMDSFNAMAYQGFGQMGLVQNHSNQLQPSGPSQSMSFISHVIPPIHDLDPGEPPPVFFEHLLDPLPDVIRVFLRSFAPEKDLYDTGAA